MTEDDVKTLVVDDKWISTLSNEVETELDQISQLLSSRLDLLAQRYGSRAMDWEQKVESYGTKVNAHLEAMGIACQ